MNNAKDYIEKEIEMLLDELDKINRSSFEAKMSLSDLEKSRVDLMSLIHDMHKMLDAYVDLGRDY